MPVRVFRRCWFYIEIYILVYCYINVYLSPQIHYRKKELRITIN